MYLKKIIAHGFKSFADKIEIELSKGTNGIVGPNGSGKSNIVDAVRWVLGEQSVKSLRGTDSMTDVIFSGSKNRHESGTASVTLIFDNIDKYLNLDYTEISIKRKVYKDGTNEYYLNNQQCRLKDITDLLLDSGIAKESFNIISQGKIEEILSNKPTDRRVIFEEAAGVLKYKKRKEESLRKIEKTNENITRADDIINELEKQVIPLKQQKDTAIKYQNLKKELEDVEISLITHDISNLNTTYLEDKRKIEKLNTELMLLSTSNSSSEAKIEDYKLNIAKKETEINELQKKLLEISKSLEKINSEKQIIIERKKYQVDDVKLHNSLVELKESELKLSNQIDSLNNEISNLDNSLQEKLKKIEFILKEINNCQDKKQKESYNLSNLLKTNNLLNIKIDTLKNEIDNNSNMPNSVKSILNNFTLNGIHNTLGNLIEVEEVYAKAIAQAISYATNNIIVDDEKSAKEAINYLKQKSNGRVTFYPLNIIKEKTIDNNTLTILKKEKGFIDIASNLVKYDKLYKNIILNQLGNVIVVDNIDTGNKISKLINYKNKIVTLSGEVFNVGGSITGGNNAIKNIINTKYELETKLKEYEENIAKIKTIENNINELDYNLKNIEDKLYLENKDKINLEELINNKKDLIKELHEKLEITTNELKGTNSLLTNSLTDEEDKIIAKFYQVEKEKNTIVSNLNNITEIKNNLKEELENYEHSIKKDNSIYNSKTKELNNLEIEVNRIDVKLDMLLNSLNETYNLTYEKAKEDYILVDDENSARLKVNNLKREITELGEVNIGAIAEYDRVSTRYEFLIKQKEDLVGAISVLNNIISEMDAVMEKEFIKTFKIIREKFNETFKELFKGGNADLKLTDPNNILETGIEIIASPPGKKLTTISLLSGGEKTFTAISLLFAILKSRQVPFCIFDEVEAALDEVNVASFGEYLNKLKEKTQFILITHKKKTMEYVDVLYGITMQESGVSKLVSVRLEEVKNN